MSMQGSAKRVLLTICDGMGFSDNAQKNAVKDAHTPTLDWLVANFPNTTIIPGGVEVGLPEGVAGNSEVGHMNLGAGRPVRQDLVRINEAISSNTLKDMPRFMELIQKAKSRSSRIHLMGLLSDGGVHSHINHLKAILDILSQDKSLSVFFHAFMDGRDTAQDSGQKYLKEFLSWNKGEFASMQGRSIGMDRDRRWEKIEISYKMLTGNGETTSLDPHTYLLKEYDNKIYDEFITPVLFNIDAKIQNDDAVFFINFRPDRAREISLAFTSQAFDHFEAKIKPHYYLCMSPYIDEECPHVPILFDREKIKLTLSEYLSSINKKQLKIAETEKYAHVTYFFNGGAEKPFPGEERILIDSPREVATYDLKPEMSAPKVLSALKEKLKDESFTLYVVNFANPDMVGHTGKYEAAIKAMECVDACLKELSDFCLTNNITMLITADHGNCDQMVYPDGSPHTSHSNAPVPFILLQKNHKNVMVAPAKTKALKDVAPTILYLLGINPPKEFTGTTIFS